MDELHRAADKFSAESTILVKQLRALAEGASSEEFALAAAQSKRVRRASTLVVRSLASARDANTLTD